MKLIFLFRIPIRKGVKNFPVKKLKESDTPDFQWITRRIGEVIFLWRTVDYPPNNNHFPLGIDPFRFEFNIHKGV